MGWILTEEGQKYLKGINIVEKAIIGQLTAFREELTEGQIKLIAHEAARRAIQDLMESECYVKPLRNAF